MPNPLKTPLNAFHPAKGFDGQRRINGQATETLQLARPLTALNTFIIVAVTRRDSDLEAFSPNPTDGSFAPLFDRTSA